MVNADAAGNSAKPEITKAMPSVSKGECLAGLARCWPDETPVPEVQFTTTANWNALPTEVSHTTSTPASLFLPGPHGHASQSQTASPSITTQTQDPSPSSSTSETTTAPTLASIGTVAEATRNNNSSGLSSGAVAGIAIGTLIIGAALAFLAAFFLFKTRRNKQMQREVNINNGTGIDYTSYADSTPELVMLQQKGATMSGLVGGRHSPYVQVSQTPIPAPVPIPVQQKSAEEQVVALLPPPAAESCIGGRFAALFEEIHRHVETYYRDVHASITPSMEPDLAKFGAGETDMAELLQDCSSATTALKHALVAYVLGITAPRKDGDGEGKTLFPEELGGMPQAEHVTDSNLTAATTLHRRLTVYIYTSSPSCPSHSNPRLSRHVQCAGRQAAAHFSLTFFPWANPTSSDQHRDEDLTRIIAEALECRIWLFGQPDIWEFEWEETGRRGVLVSPGLVRRNRDGVERLVEGVIVGI